MIRPRRGSFALIALGNTTKAQALRLPGGVGSCSWDSKRNGALSGMLGLKAMGVELSKRLAITFSERFLEPQPTNLTFISRGVPLCFDNE